MRVRKIHAFFHILVRNSAHSVRADSRRRANAKTALQKCRLQVQQQKLPDRVQRLPHLLPLNIRHARGHFHLSSLPKLHALPKVSKDPASDWYIHEIFRASEIRNGDSSSPVYAQPYIHTQRQLSRSPNPTELINWSKFRCRDYSPILHFIGITPGCRATARHRRLSRMFTTSRVNPQKRVTRRTAVDDAHSLPFSELYERYMESRSAEVRVRKDTAFDSVAPPRCHLYARASHW